MIRRVKLVDASEIGKIYNSYIINTVVTFEETTVSTKEIEDRIQAIHSKLPWIVYETNGKIVGYAYASEWKSRSAYKRTAECTVYLKPNQQQKGIGSALYSELIKLLTEMRFHAIIGGIALPNEPSIYLHKKFGFEKVAHFKEVGYKFKKWVDVEYWELLIQENKQQ